LHATLRAQGLDERAPDRTGVPAMRGSIAAPALWLQDEVPGRRLADLLRPGADTAPAARTGAALARLIAATMEKEHEERPGRPDERAAVYGLEVMFQRRF